MTADLFRTLIIAAPVADEVRQLAASWSGGVGMFETALTDDPDAEQPTITHYISTGYISAAIATALSWTEYTVDDQGHQIAIQHPGDIPTLVEWINEQTGAGVTVEQIEALMGYADISTQPPREAMARLGLSVYSEVPDAT